MFDATRRFLSAQFETTAPLYILLVTSIMHFFWCWLFVTKLGWKEFGAAMAANITYCLNFVIIELYCCMKESLRKTYQGKPDAHAFHNIGEYLKIGIPGVCMLCFEWWCFELLAISAGLMSVEALAA